MSGEHPSPSPEPTGATHVEQNPKPEFSQEELDRAYESFELFNRSIMAGQPGAHDALYHLTMLCRRSDYSVPEESRENLVRALNNIGLMDAEGVPYPAVRQIVHEHVYGNDLSDLRYSSLRRVEPSA